MLCIFLFLSQPNIFNERQISVLSAVRSGRAGDTVEVGRQTAVRGNSQARRLPVAKFMGGESRVHAKSCITYLILVAR